MALIGVSKSSKGPTSYAEWSEEAKAYDARTGGDLWKARDATDLYDYKTIRARLEELHGIRESGDSQRLLYYLHEGVHGNMGGMGSARLYGRSRFGTKDLIYTYVRELASGIEQIADVPESEISLAEKVAFFRRASDCFGRSALMLSGAGSLGPFHVGVVRALAEENLLPSVISGSSAGSFIASIAGTHRDDELKTLLRSDATTGLMKQGAADPESRVGNTLKQDEVRAMIESIVPDLTFEEAFEETGRQINITVAAAEVQQNSRLLNAITSPNAYIREAVLASCAVPGVFPSVQLAAKTASGQRIPYVASRRWVDGSVSDDLPARRLMRLYGVNHFISSQANPIVLWALTDPDTSSSLLGRLTSIAQSSIRDWSRLAYPFTMDLVRNVYPVNVWTRLWFGLLSQDYTADINILPSQRFFNPAKLLAVLSEEEVEGLIREGERSTWPKIEMIRNCTKISRTLDEVGMRIDRKLVAA